MKAEHCLSGDAKLFLAGFAGSHTWTFWLELADVRRDLFAGFRTPRSFLRSEHGGWNTPPTSGSRSLAQETGAGEAAGTF